MELRGIVLIPGAPRPEAIEVYTTHDNERGGSRGGYFELIADLNGRVTEVREVRLVMVGHEPCGWSHPSWEDETDRRMKAHLAGCDFGWEPTT